MKLISGIFLRW